MPTNRKKYPRTEAHLRAERAYRARNPERVLEGQRRYRLRTKFGLSVPEYQTLVASQNGRCDICYKTADEKGIPVLYVDHDHISGQVRKLLCRECNAILGFCEDNPQILQRAINYLGEHAN